MTEENRRDWLAVAWGTLKHLPGDLLTMGCKKARETCDHPAKIVPAILAATEQPMRWRRETAHEALPPAAQLPKPDYCTPDQASEILREFGFRGVGSRAAT